MSQYKTLPNCTNGIIEENKEKEFSFIELLNEIRAEMKGKYKQRPQMSSSHP